MVNEEEKEFVQGLARAEVLEEMDRVIKYLNKLAANERRQGNIREAELMEIKCSIYKKMMEIWVEVTEKQETGAA